MEMTKFLEQSFKPWYYPSNLIPSELVKFSAPIFAWTAVAKLVDIFITPVSDGLLKDGIILSALAGLLVNSANYSEGNSTPDNLYAFQNGIRIFAQEALYAREPSIKLEALAKLPPHVTAHDLDIAYGGLQAITNLRMSFAKPLSDVSPPIVAKLQAFFFMRDKVLGYIPAQMNTLDLVGAFNDICKDDNLVDVNNDYARDTMGYTRLANKLRDSFERRIGMSSSS